MDGEGTQTQLQKATGSDIYRDMLIIRLRDISDLYSNLLSKYAKVIMDEDLFNSLISEMVVVAGHLIAKLEGGGEQTKEILKEFEEFSDWFDDIIKPKMDVTEQKKVHKLFRLILRAYNKLGLSSY